LKDKMDYGGVDKRRTKKVNFENKIFMLLFPFKNI